MASGSLMSVSGAAYLSRARRLSVRNGTVVFPTRPPWVCRYACHGFPMGATTSGLRPSSGDEAPVLRRDTNPSSGCRVGSSLPPPRSPAGFPSPRPVCVQQPRLARSSLCPAGINRGAHRDTCTGPPSPNTMASQQRSSRVRAHTRPATPSRPFAPVPPTRPCPLGPPRLCPFVPLHLCAFARTPPAPAPPRLRVTHPTPGRGTCFASTPS